MRDGGDAQPRFVAQEALQPVERAQAGRGIHAARSQRAGDLPHAVLEALLQRIGVAAADEGLARAHLVLAVF